MPNPIIKRFCQVVEEIRERNKQLDKERRSFYDGGHSFEDCHEPQMKELEELENEFMTLLGLLQEKQS